MKLGIVGLPNVGKSTLFNSLTKAGAESANYPFCTIDPNIGIVTVPDERLKLLGDMYKSKKVTPAVIEFVDIAGLVKGASKGEGLGNQFLSNIREVDAVVHVVRCFEDANVIHVDGNVNPLRDIETINLELIFSDIEILERRIAKTGKAAKMDKSLAKEAALLEALKAHLEDGKLAKSYETDDEDEQALLASYNLLTYKPVIFAANVAEDDLENALLKLIKGESMDVYDLLDIVDTIAAKADNDIKFMRYYYMMLILHNDSNMKIELYNELIKLVEDGINDNKLTEIMDEIKLSFITSYIFSKYDINIDNYIFYLENEYKLIYRIKKNDDGKSLEEYFNMKAPYYALYEFFKQKNLVTERSNNE